MKRKGAKAEQVGVWRRTHHGEGETTWTVKLDNGSRVRVLRLRGVDALTIVTVAKGSCYTKSISLRKETAVAVSRQVLKICGAGK